MILYHDVPSCQGVENVLRRAKQLADLRYTPVRALPTVVKVLSANDDGEANYAELRSPAHLPLTGVIYSSVRRTETYVGFNISPETFLTAVSDPYSVVYEKPIEGVNQNVHNHYGIVCSCFASYCMNLHYRTACRYWPSIPGVHPVDSSKLENLALADVVLHVKKHIALITDIERDAEGNVHYITVSESVLPQIRVTRFTPEEFRGYWLDKEFKIYRYDGVKDVPYTPDPFAPVPGDPEMPVPKINRILMPDFGNKANYKKGLEPVELHVFDPAYGKVEVTDPDGCVSAAAVENGKVQLLPEKTGIYTACAVKDGSGEKSDAVTFRITDLTIASDKEAYAPGEMIRLAVRNPEKDPIIAWQANNHANDKGAGAGWLDLREETEISVPMPEKAEEVELYLIARNSFGCYSSQRIVLKRLM